ncbi:MAG TPA: aminoglycoside phosphotransferase family protein [Puia sp.]|nr:aminoglycoside phosphotransferase family protein [Puia sp.]
MLSDVLAAYDLPEEHCSIQPFGNGLINNTWKIGYLGRSYILQRINQHVFRDPFAIAENIETVGNYLQELHPSYLFVHPIATAAGQTIIQDEQHGYFRLFPFVEHSHTIDVVKTTTQAFEAAAQFGRFTRLLSGFDPEKLHITLPDFHNLSLRYHRFTEAVQKAGAPRKDQAREVIEFLIAQEEIVQTWLDIQQNPAFKKRVTHHDTKISNVLFDASDKGLCVIDLDTVMPGFFISDVGDMMRTYLSPVSEEETDFSKIGVRDDYFMAIVNGYLGETREELSAEEKKYFIYAGKFMIFMQAIRFLTDYLQDDVYYGQQYEGHNLKRAGNQATLLQKLTEKEEQLLKSIAGMESNLYFHDPSAGWENLQRWARPCS